MTQWVVKDGYGPDNGGGFVVKKFSTKEAAEKFATEHNNEAIRSCELYWVEREAE